MIADHGLVYTPQNFNYILKNHPDIIANLTMHPSEENCLPYLFVRPGRESKLKSYIDQAWQGKFQMFPSLLMLESGLMGDCSLYPPVEDRIGDWAVIPRGDAYWW